jgi:hypothetical protein
MSRVGLVMDGELQVFEAAHWAAISEDYPDAVTVEVPPGFPETHRWTGQGFMPRGPVLTGQEVVNLFTPEEIQAIVGYHNPENPEAEANVRALVTALALNLGNRIDCAGTYHQQGVAALLGLGLLTPARAVRVAAGLPPQPDP